MQIPFDNSYARLPDRFYAPVAPTHVAEPRLVRINLALAETLGLDAGALAASDGVAALAGNLVPDGAEPIALAYAGHQFGHFVPQLGDGRACLLGEVVGRDGQRRDIQLKGSGPTPFSRNGDGRAALGPVLREYLVSEAMAALGVPTTRALAAVTTGEPVYRETILPGAVLTRVAASHIRVGTFQYFAAQGDEDAVRTLADYAIARHYPAAAGSYRAFLDAVIAAQTDLVSKWLLLGFIHGVMNTDNCAISGETIDYGPCAFMDAYDPATVFSSIDRGGRYAYGNQGRIVLWNLARLAETLIPLLPGGEEEAKDALSVFPPCFQAAYFGGLRRKIGLTEQREGDDDLTQDLLRLMAEHHADFTLTFRRLADAATGDDTALRPMFADDAGLDAWLEKWRARLAGQDSSSVQAALRAVNPLFIPRNHLVEATLNAATERGDFGPFEELLAVVSKPFADDPSLERFTMPPREEERVLQTFCGT
jgi:serine/tyrosine/threonine adenylyltransferase